MESAVTDGRYRILCVEDNPDSCELLRLLIEADHPEYSVTAAMHPDEALKLIAGTTFDLYILDLWLPEMSGLDLARKIRETSPSVPIMMYSAIGRDSDRREGLAAGVDEFLIKPNDMDQIVPTVERLLNGRPRARVQS